MTYDPDQHERETTRLQGWDHASAGVYFITCCAYDREWIFGEVKEGRVVLNKVGRIVGEEWRKSGNLRQEITLDEYVIMPNHIHGIVVVAPFGLGSAAGMYTRPERFTSDGQSNVAGRTIDVVTHGRASLHRPLRSLGALVAGFKAATTKRINELRGTPGARVWQSRYHDRIIRNHAEHEALRWYIRHNPARWEDDYLYA